MDELQKQVLTEVNNLVNNLMDQIKDSEQEGAEIDLTKFTKELSNVNLNINKSFIEAKLRLGKGKKGGIFG